MLKFQGFRVKKLMKYFILLKINKIFKSTIYIIKRNAQIFGILIKKI